MTTPPPDTRQPDTRGRPDARRRPDTPAPADARRAVLDPIECAIDELAVGRPVVVVDDADRENEGDLVLPAEAVTPELVAFMMRECRGLICAPLAPELVDALELPPMVERSTEPLGTAFTVSVDASGRGVTTGIAATDRSTTIRLLADAEARPDDFVRPGHVFPLRARPGGVAERAGHTEAAVELARLAGWRPAAAIVEIAGDDGRMLRLPELRAFAAPHGWAVVSIADLAARGTRPGDAVPGTRTGGADVEPPGAGDGQRATDPDQPDPRTDAGQPDPRTDGAAEPERITATATVRLPTRHGDFTAYGYRVDGSEHLALVAGAPEELRDGEDVLVRLHSECLTGDVFGSARCDCGPQLDAALERVHAEGRGVVLYLRGHEGRGIGLSAKLRAYELQERGRDTVDANLELGLPADARDYAAAGAVLRELGVRSARLVTNNPRKSAALEAAGIRVVREPHPTPPGPHNLTYLRAKRDRMGHELPWLDEDDRSIG